MYWSAGRVQKIKPQRQTGQHSWITAGYFVPSLFTSEKKFDPLSSWRQDTPYLNKPVFNLILLCQYTIIPVWIIFSFMQMCGSPLGILEKLGLNAEKRKIPGENYHVKWTAYIGVNLFPVYTKHGAWHPSRYKPVILGYLKSWIR